MPPDLTEIHEEEDRLLQPSLAGEKAFCEAIDSDAYPFAEKLSAHGKQLMFMMEKLNITHPKGNDAFAYILSASNDRARKERIREVFKGDIDAASEVDAQRMENHVAAFDSLCARYKGQLLEFHSELQFYEGNHITFKDRALFYRSHSLTKWDMGSASEAPVESDDETIKLIDKYAPDLFQTNRRIRIALDKYPSKPKKKISGVIKKVEIGTTTGILY